MSKISPIIDGYKSLNLRWQSLRRGIGAPEPGEQLLTRRQLHSLRMEIERQLGSKSFAVGCFACVSGAGTTTVTLEIGRLLAESSDGEVAILDANLRSSSDLNVEKGMAEYLRGEVSLQEIVRESPHTRCKFVSAGTLQSDKDESIFPSQRLTTLLAELREIFTVVILDCPPIDSHPDTLFLCSHIDGLILVLESESDRWEAAQNAMRVVESSGGRVIGAVINKKRFYIPEWLYRIL